MGALLNGSAPIFLFQLPPLKASSDPQWPDALPEGDLAIVVDRN